MRERTDRGVTYDIVGCGAVVASLHAPVINALRDGGGITVAGCYDPNEDLAEAIASTVGAERWGPHPEPGEGDGVDAALVATPPDFHAEIAGRYIEAGKGVFVEKPFSRTKAEAAGLVEAAHERGVPVAVNQLLRYYPTVEGARQFLSGELDRIDSIEASDGFRWDWPASSYVVKDAYGGVIHDTGAHIVDTVVYLLGLDSAPEPVSVRLAGVSKKPDREPSHECRAEIVLETGGREARIGLWLSRLRPLPRGIRVFGSFGTLFVPLFAPGPILFRDGAALRVRGAEPSDRAVDVPGCVLLAYRDFLARARDPEIRTRIDGDRFLLQMELLEALHGERSR